MGRIGIMGGTFNPIHFGHLMLAESAREEMALDEVWFIPTGYSYMKSAELRNNVSVSMPQAKERLEMTQLALEDHSCFRCLDIEVRREGYTYSYETLEELKALYPEHSFFFIFGADCLFQIENWRLPQRIFAVCEIVAAVRGDADIAMMEEKILQLRHKYQARISLLPFRNIQLSSTDIRNRVKEQRSIRYMTPEKVVSYIQAKGFYREVKDGT